MLKSVAPLHPKKNNPKGSDGTHIGRTMEKGRVVRGWGPLGESDVSDAPLPRKNTAHIRNTVLRGLSWFKGTLV